MLSYRHGFHAGNHGDVIKHLCQCLILEKLREKDKAFVYMDTHSGAGIYDLASEESSKTAEHAEGIGKIKGYQGDNQNIIAYLDVVNSYLNQSKYPGSPELARLGTRSQDKLILMELHNSEIKNLKWHLRGKNLMIHHRDGLEGLVALLPPTPNRGLVLIDPSYELAEDYALVSNALKSAIKKWPTGIYAIWYPILGQRARKKHSHCEKMLDEFTQLPVKSCLRAELIVEQDSPEAGMIGSGMAIINVPWQLDSQIQAILPELVNLLGKNQQGQYKVDWLVEEA